MHRLVRVSDLFRQSIQRLNDPERTIAVELLISKAFGWSRTQFWIHKNQFISSGIEWRRFNRWFHRLLKGEPLSYILGEKEFYSILFYVNRQVLIPRPETELLVEQSISFAKKRPGIKILEIGPGSGNISIPIALHSHASILALETSPSALRVLKKNIARYNLQEKITAKRGDLFPDQRKPFDLIVSNPPYLSTWEWEGLPSPIKDYEPRSALVAGTRGTEILEKIILQAPGFLSPGGRLLLEIGKDQRLFLEKTVMCARYSSWTWEKDYQGLDRILIADL